MQFQPQLFSSQQQQYQPNTNNRYQPQRFASHGQQQSIVPYHNGMNNGSSAAAAAAAAANGSSGVGAPGSQDAASSVQQPAEYSLAGILHYLQSEWRRYEKDRNEWEIERAEMRARIALLEGEKRGAENLKTNLMRRVKMLEYALKQERSKYLSTSPSAAALKHPAIAGIERESVIAGSGRSSPVRLDDGDHPAGRPSTLAAASTLLNRHTSTSKDYRSRDKSREYLKQCLQEISYLTSHTTLNPLPERGSIMPGSIFAGGPPRPKKAMSEDVGAQTTGLAELGESGGQHGGVVVDDASSSFSDVDASSTAAAMTRTTGNSDDWSKLRQAGAPANGLSQMDSTEVDSASSIDDSMARARRLMREAGSSSSTISSSSSHTASSIDSAEEELLSEEADAASEESQRWKLKRLLTHHRSAVKSIAFDDGNVTLVSGSSDRSLKLVHLNCSSGNQSSSFKQRGDVITLSGHTNTVTSIAVSSSRRRIFSGSLDSQLCIWALDYQANSNGENEDDADSANRHEALATIKTDSEILDLVLLPHPGSDNPRDVVLATASADGLVRLYRCSDDIGDTPELVRSFDYFGVDASGDEVEHERESLRQEAGGLPLPTSICAVHSNLKDCAVAFSNAIVKTFSVSTGAETARLKLDQSYDGTPATQINVVISHPTLPLLLTGHEDKFLRIVDIYTGAIVSSLHAHKDAVTTLDVDPAGLKLLTGGHDGAVRIWDIAKLASPFADDSSSHSEKKKNRTKKLGKRMRAGVNHRGSAVQGKGSKDEGDVGEDGGQQEHNEEEGEGEEEEGEEEEEEEEEGSIELFQELSDHMRATSTGQGVLAVRYHSSLPCFATAGADGAVRIYG